MLRAVVLGAAGFIGRHVTAALTQGSQPVDVLRLGRSGDGGPSDRHVRLDLTRVPVEELAAVLRTFAPDAVVNCVGAMSGPARVLFEANTVAVDTLLHAVALGAPAARVVQRGSAAEYGATGPGRPIREDKCPRPLSAYGISKLAATQLVSEAHASGRVDAVVLRVFNPIGPGQPTATVLGRAAAAIKEAVAAGAATVKLGPLEAFRDFVDVRDVARAVTCAIRTARPGRVVFNVARGEAIQVREMVRRLAEHAGFPGGIDERAVGSARSGAVAWQEADVENAAIGLGWVPRFELDASVRGVWETYDAA